MIFNNIFLLSIILSVITEIFGHGMLMDPVNRGSAWRENFNTPINYNDNSNHCGSYNVQYSINGGRCGLCGDDYRDPVPRKNEDGGIYGRRTIVKTYKRGDYIVVRVVLTANHLGFFEFSLCPLDKYAESEECFNQFPLYLTNGERRYYLKSNQAGNYEVHLYLPDNVFCEYCTLRWHYTAGNNWGVCDNGKGALGCGNQENFRTCSDIRIIP